MIENIINLDLNSRDIQKLEGLINLTLDLDDPIFLRVVKTLTEILDGFEQGDRNRSIRPLSASFKVRFGDLVSITNLAEKESQIRKQDRSLLTLSHKLALAVERHGCKKIDGKWDLPKEGEKDEY